MHGRAALRNLIGDRINGSDDDIDLTVGHVIDCLASTRGRLRTAIQAVTGAGLSEGVVLCGRLNCLPLAVRAIADTVGTTSPVAGLDAAARGLSCCSRVGCLAPTECQAVTLPTHRIRDGLLEEVSVIPPCTSPFAILPGDQRSIDREELELTIAGQFCTARLRGLAPGPHRVGVRPTWPGPGVLVARPVIGDSAHVVSSATLTAP